MDKNLELRRLYSQSFDDSEAFVDYFFENMTTPEKVVSLVRDGKTVSALHLLDRTIFLRGGLFDMPFVVAAATVKELRGMRLLENVMKTAFDRLYSTGKTFVALYPFKHAYYKKYGFVTYTSCVKREIKFKKDDGINILPATSKEMLKIYNRFCFGKQGYIVRQIEDYDELLKRWSVDELISFVVKKSEREAYAVFSPFSKEIEEACGDIELFDGVKELDGKICSDFNGETEEYAMVRLVDIKRALEGIHYDSDGTFDFILKDNFFPRNDGAYRLTVNEGRGTLVQISPNNAFAKICIEQLTLWIFGKGGLNCTLLKPQKTFCIDKY